MASGDIYIVIILHCVASGDSRQRLLVRMTFVKAMQKVRNIEFQVQRKSQYWNTEIFD